MKLKSALGTTALVTVMGVPAYAQLNVDSVVQQLRDRGYTYIEVTTGPSQTKVEGEGGGRDIEVIYDSATGDILYMDMDDDDDEDDEETGVEFGSSDRDFFSDGFVSDDDDDEDDDDKDDDDDDDDEEDDVDDDDDEEDDDEEPSEEDDDDDDDEEDDDDDEDDDEEEGEG